MTLDVIIVNLTRFGDLLQTQPFLHAAHAQGLRCGLICLENFTATLPLLRHVHGAWAIPGASVLRALEEGHGIQWREALAATTAAVRQIRNEARPRAILNLTATLSSRLWARLLAFPEADGEMRPIHGFAVDEYGYGCCSNVWAAYLGASTLRRDNACFNIADMFCRVGWPLLELDSLPVQRERGLALPQQQHSIPLPEGPFIGFQLGASVAARQWPVAFFVRLGDMLWQRCGLRPVLLGSRAERALAEEYASLAQHPFVDAVGATSLTELASLLMQVRLLVSNDTGTLHLAAGLGIPSLAFFLATAQPCDTGPYLENCCCLEPALACHPCEFSCPCPHQTQCRTHIQPEGVARLIEQWIATGAWQIAPDDALAREARIWITERDRTGFMSVLCHSAHRQEARSLWLHWQRVWWRQTLDNMQRVFLGKTPQLEEDSLAEEEILLSEKELSILSQTAKLVHLVSVQGKALYNEAMKARFLHSIEQVQTLLDSCTRLPVLGYIWREFRQSFTGNIENLLCTFSLFSRQLDLLVAARPGKKGQ